MGVRHSFRYQAANLLRHYGVNFRESERPEVISMQKAINELDNHNINFVITTYPDGSWMAKATNIDGLLTGSRNQSEIDECIKDAIFTYFGVPPQYATDKLLRNMGEPVRTEQQIHVAV